MKQNGGMLLAGNGRSRSTFGGVVAAKNHGNVDRRVDLGQQLQPYGRFDADIERFCCRDCGYKSQTYRGIEAHILDGHSFFASQSIRELAEAQKVTPLKHASSFEGAFPQDEDVDEFLKEIYSTRE